MFQTTVIRILLAILAAMSVHAADWRAELKRANDLFDRGEHADSLTLYQNVLDQATAAKAPPTELAGIQCRLAAARAKLGQQSTALLDLAKAIAILRHENDKTTLSACLTYLGAIHREAGNYLQARAAFQESVQIEQHLHSPKQLANSLSLLGDLEQLTGNSSSAAEILKRLDTLERSGTLGPDSTSAETLSALATLARGLRNHQEATAYAERALAQPANPALRLKLLAILATSNADLRRTYAATKWAAQLERESLALHSLTPEEQASTAVALGYVAERQDEWKKADQLYTRASAALTEQNAGGILGAGIIALQLGRVKKARKDYAAAEAHLQHSLAIFSNALGAGHYLIASALLDLADTYRVERNYEQAAAAYRRGLNMAEDLVGIANPELIGAYQNFAKVLDIRKERQEAKLYYDRSRQASETRESFRRQSTIDIGDLQKSR